MEIDRKIQKVSLDVFLAMFEFLNIQDINMFASTCKHYHNLFTVKIISEKSTNLIENQADANILYMSSIIDKKKSFGQISFNLQLFRFFVTSKDQGWVKDCQSGSWVEAQFLPLQDEQNKENHLNTKLINKKEPLIFNYQVRDFQTKTKIMNNSSQISDSDKMNIYLRSSGEGWTISCKQIQIQKIYSRYMKLCPKQLETTAKILKKKFGRKAMNRRQKTIFPRN